MRQAQPIEAGPAWQVIEGDELAYHAISLERQKADPTGTPLRRHQVLRVLLMRAARCRCGTA